MNIGKFNGVSDGIWTRDNRFHRPRPQKTETL